MRQYRNRNGQDRGRRRSRKARKVWRRSLESSLPTCSSPDHVISERTVVSRLTIERKRRAGFPLAGPEHHVIVQLPLRFALR